MSRVDKTDQLMVHNACGRKSLQWYTRIYWHMLDPAILNAFIRHKAVISPNCREFTHKKFRMDLAYAFKVAQHPVFLRLTNLEIHADRLFAFLGVSKQYILGHCCLSAASRHKLASTSKHYSLLTATDTTALY